ncbi:hypothetical protein KM043_012396 [Ampulex compressa]|nr:hypothetical protein KM043_012396 [Ampulex compressa]
MNETSAGERADICRDPFSLLSMLPPSTRSVMAGIAISSTPDYPNAYKLSDFDMTLCGNASKCSQAFARWSDIRSAWAQQFGILENCAEPGLNGSALSY